MCAILSTLVQFLFYDVTGIINLLHVVKTFKKASICMQLTSAKCNMTYNTESIPVLKPSYIGTKFDDKNPSIMLSFEEANPKVNQINSNI